MCGRSQKQNLFGLDRHSSKFQSGAVKSYPPPLVPSSASTKNRPSSRGPSHVGRKPAVLMLQSHALAPNRTKTRGSNYSKFQGGAAPTAATGSTGTKIRHSSRGPSHVGARTEASGADATTAPYKQHKTRRIGSDVLLHPPPPAQKPAAQKPGLPQGDRAMWEPGRKPAVMMLQFSRTGSKQDKNP